jgi:hypothetical protein
MIERCAGELHAMALSVMGYLLVKQGCSAGNACANSYQKQSGQDTKYLVSSGDAYSNV